MSHIADVLLTDLRHSIRELGKGGGMNSPSIYETAQVLRFMPPAGMIWPALEWLEMQQQPDGGWGEPAVPRARDVSTLAAILALQKYGSRVHEQHSIYAGLAFLRHQASYWARLTDDLPVGVELLLPHLLEETARAGLKIPIEPYVQLIALGKHRRKLIAGREWPPGTPPVHSWEGWGVEPSPALLDGTGGVGHSSAATAAWLQAARDRPDLAEARERALGYLERAATMTGVGLPGVVPGVWPINHFELVFGMYMLCLAGLLRHPALRDTIEPQVQTLKAAFRPEGIGFSDYFMPDGDDTAAALAILHTAGQSVSSAPLRRFAVNSHFCAFPGELQPSLSVVAHAAHALCLLGEDPAAAYSYIIEQQQSDGRWMGDKWQSSWLYTTSQALLALPYQRYARQLDRAIDEIVSYQAPSGGWGSHHGPTTEETAYGVLALRHLRRQGVLHEEGQLALAAAEQWMLDQYQPFRQRAPQLWLDKDAYRPLRIVRIVELVATLPEQAYADATSTTLSAKTRG
ncbi:MAG TPA: prenyltransferase/squalene oxidase repeat-containing protein [Kouleothrix sp.]|uniref:prenyltransferase/squalene oxidase repeat-containing protein n=1 Tax=Kouleothrix sp. TaxID=2779161 RepID=UPI002B882DDA|nr:prenyltransferase/squalene oxidase repeat-containing protein [Kouleothrix sp.]HRC74033.1 prenyltransferase/squalene oxidase repeat-containing protein [Kouleothrix sp.]